MEQTGVSIPSPILALSNKSSPGLEEYIEGLSFLHYLEKRELISLVEVQKTLSDDKSGEPASL